MDINITPASETNVDRLLEQHGLPPRPLLTEVLNAGQQVLAACTSDDPPSARGNYVWGRMTRTIRELTRPAGWQRSDEGNFATVVSPDGSLQIAVASGDEATGVVTEVPKTKYPRGAVSRRAINENQAVIAAFSAFMPKKESPRGDLILTWVLLHRRLKDTVLWELSLPSDVDESGTILAWSPRIILPPVSFAPVDDALLCATEINPDDYDPVVTRKKME